MMSERRLIIGFLLFVPILYANSIGGDFIFDDIFLVRDNPYLGSFADFISYFTSGTRELGGRPVRLTSLYLDTLIFGKSNVGYHISNILYYMIYCTLVYFFSARLFRDRFLALAVTLLFVAHPLHTEGVAYISGKKDVLGGIFSVASLISYDRYIQGYHKRDALLTILFFLLAMGAKEIYAILPLLFLTMNFFRGVPLRNQRIFHLSLLTVASVFVIYVIFVRNIVFFDYLHPIPVYGDDKGVNFPTAIKICGLILSLNFFPFDLSADYTFNVVKRIDFSDWAFFLSTSAILFMGLGILLLRSRQKEISLGLLWLLVCLLPVCQLVPYPEIISERSLILLSFGSCVILACLISRLPKKWAIGILVSVLAVFSVTTIRRNLDWRDEFSLWRATAKQHPDCARARYNFGIALATKKEFRAAEQEFRASLAINPPDLITVPDYSMDALLNLGNVYAFRGDFVRAKDCYQEVLRHDPEHRLALSNLNTLERLEEEGEAIKRYESIPRSIRRHIQE
jgi:tetratricopeptide (TPR) repeat protein